MSGCRMLGKRYLVMLCLDLPDAQSGVAKTIIMMEHSRSGDLISHAKEPFSQSFENISIISSIDNLSWRYKLLVDHTLSVEKGNQHFFYFCFVCWSFSNAMFRYRLSKKSDPIWTCSKKTHKWSSLDSIFDGPSTFWVPAWCTCWDCYVAIWWLIFCVIIVTLIGRSEMNISHTRVTFSSV